MGYVATVLQHALTAREVGGGWAALAMGNAVEAPVRIGVPGANTRIVIFGTKSGFVMTCHESHIVKFSGILLMPEEGLEPPTRGL